MRVWFLILLLSLSPLLLAEPTVIQMGDGQVDGLLIRAYQQVWRQCSFKEGEWVDGGTFTETAIEVKDGQRLLRVEQGTERPDGTRSYTIVHFDRSTLSPLLMETRVHDSNDKEVGSTNYVLTADGYVGQLVRGKDTQDVAGSAVTSDQFLGSNFGLVLATLNPEEDFPLELPASMIRFDAGYRVIASVAGRETLDMPHGPVQSWMIDVEWHHLELGDIYPGGPDASGGRYWIVPNPPAGVPYVPRYKTDTYAVEFIPGTCPKTD